MNLDSYINLFNQNLENIDKEEMELDDIYQIGFMIMNDEINRLSEIIVKKDKKINLLEMKLDKGNKKTKKVKYDKRIEKKVVNLIVKYRKTMQEIKDIILEENNLRISDRSINEIRKNNNIKGYRIIES